MQEFISVPCSGCRAPLRTSVRNAGRKLKCPKCGIQIEVPQQSESSPEIIERKAVPLVRHKGIIVSVATALLVGLSLLSLGMIRRNWRPEPAELAKTDPLQSSADIVSELEEKQAKPEAPKPPDNREEDVRKAEKLRARNEVLAQVDQHLEADEYGKALDACDALVKLGEPVAVLYDVRGRVLDAWIAAAETVSELSEILSRIDRLISLKGFQGFNARRDKVRIQRVRTALQEDNPGFALACYRSLYEDRKTHPAMRDLGLELLTELTRRYEESKSRQSEVHVLEVATILMDDEYQSTSVQAALRRLTMVIADHPATAAGDADQVAGDIVLKVPPDKEGLPEWTEISRRLAIRSSDRGLLQCREGRLSDGIANFDRAIQLDPEQRTVIQEMVRTLPSNSRRQLGRYLPESEADFEEYLDFVSDDTVGYSVVFNMSEFSTKIDELWTMLGWKPLDALAMAQEYSKIRKGINTEGNLVFLKFSRQSGSRWDPKEIVYLVASSDADALIYNIRRPKGNRKFDPETGLTPVHMNSLEGFARPFGSFVAFAELSDERLLKTLKRQTEPRDESYLPLNGWNVTLDAFFVISKRGLREGVASLELPFVTFPVGAYPLALKQPPGELQQFAGGVRLDPKGGILLSGRSWMESQENQIDTFRLPDGHREGSLNRLPLIPAIVALGGPVNPELSREISNTVEMLTEQPLDDLQITSIQASISMPVVDLFPGDTLIGKFWNETMLRTPRGVLVLSVNDSAFAFQAIENWLRKARIELPAMIGFPELQNIDRNGMRVRRIPIGVITGIDQFAPLVLDFAVTAGDEILIVIGNVTELDAILQALQNPARLSESRFVRSSSSLMPKDTSWLLAINMRNVAKLVVMMLRLAETEAVQEDERGREMVEAMEDRIEQMSDNAGMGVGLKWKERVVDLNINASPEAIRLVVPTVFDWIRFTPKIPDSI